MADQSGAEISAGGISQLEQSFQYSPLDPSVDGIRLLILEPGAKGEIPTCTLRHVTFRQRPKYEALSYTWGDETHRQNILLEGHSFSITKNLYNALCGLRRTSEPRQLWADAICINQEDIPERNRQLSLMPFVYERAQTVLIWLGLCEMELARDSLTPPSSSEKAQSVLDWSIVSADTELMKVICCNPYWDRLWIIQEVAKARRLSVHIGDNQIDWQELLPLLHGSPYFNSSGAQRLEHHLANKYEKFQKLEQLLEAHKHALCKDPRDKVYGLLGLDAGWLHFSVDYSKSLYGVWKDTVLFQKTAPFRPSRTCLSFSQLVKDCLGGDKIASTEELVQDLSLEMSSNSTESTLIDQQVSVESTSTILRIPARELGRILCIGPSYSQVISDASMVAKWRFTIQTRVPISERPEAREENELFLQALEEIADSDFEIISSCHLESPWLSPSSVDDTAEPNGKSGLSVFERHYMRSSTAETGSDTTSSSMDGTGTCLYLLDTPGKNGSGRMGVGPCNTRAGDWIYAIDGLHKVAVLRSSSGRLNLVGTAGLAPSVQQASGAVSKQLFMHKYFVSENSNSKDLPLFASEVWYLLDKSTRTSA